MYLPVPSQPDCASAWREAVRAVDAQPGHGAYNVIIDVADPTANATAQDARIEIVDDFCLAMTNRWRRSRTPSFRQGSITDTGRPPSSMCSVTRC